MDRVIEELDDARAEIEKLRVECRVKGELSNNLKRSHNEQLNKIQELNLKLEKQSEEINAKTDEVYAVAQMLEDLKCNLKEKETIIKGLGASNERLRVDNNEKLRKCEEKKTELVFLLDEAKSKNLAFEQKIQALEEEIEGLKEQFVSVSQKKCSEANKMAKASKEMRQKDDMLIKLEEDNSKLEDQLKWKKEQFTHLEEAHQKLHNHLQAKETEWDIEKSTLLDEISTVQTNLDSQNRVCEGLKKRLEACNQALAHEESRRKYLEIQLSESKLCFENVSSECEEAKLEIECLTSQRDKDIACLRNLMGEKETGCKEMEYRVGKLEEENQELKTSLKELQEAQIQEASTSRLRNKLKSLEQIHRGCSTKLEAKEAEWSSQFETVTMDLNFCRSELENKEARIQVLTAELDDCNSLITNLILQNEESCIMVLMLKSRFLDARLKIDEDKADKNLKSTENEKAVSVFPTELKSRNIALLKAQESLEEEREKVALLLRKMESLEFDKEEKLLLQKDIDRRQEMLKESSACQARLKEQMLQVKSELRIVSNLLDRANNELAQKFCDGNEVEFELQIWKSIAERLKVDLAQNHQMRREVEASLLAQVSTEVNLRQEKDGLVHVLEEKESRIDELQQKLTSMHQELKTREMEAALPTRKEMETPRGAREKSDELEQEMELWEQEWLKKELEGAILAQIDAEKIHLHEKESLNQIVEEKDQRINDLQPIMRSLDADFEHSSTSFSSQLVKMQTEMDLRHEAWQKMATAQVLKEIEIEEKNLIIVELENGFSMLQQKLELGEKSLSTSKERREELESELEAKQSEVQKLTCQFEKELALSDALIKNLDTEKSNLLENVVKLSSERDSLFGLVEELSERIGKFSSLDTQLSGSLERTVYGFNEIEGDEFFDPVKENLSIHPSPRVNKVENTHDERSPLRVCKSLASGGTEAIFYIAGMT